MKIGILSLFFKNYNYGGQLQAYALCRVLNNLLNKKGTAEQICYDHLKDKFPRIPSEPKLKRILKAPFKEKVKLITDAVKRYLPKKDLKSVISNEVLQRKNAFDDFVENNTKHSEKIYSLNTLCDANKEYDAFVVGSDQVWNPLFYNPAYFLSFAGKDKYKASYAASISQASLTANQAIVYKKHLQSFDQISLREKNVKILESVTNRSIQWVLDPTLLLSEKEWDSVCSARLVSEKYIFCYFLGDDKKQRRLAFEYSKKHNLKIVTLPYLLNRFRKCDEGFGDIKLFSVSPADFISLIKYAEFVFTDSFHASVFSYIYKKQFIVFGRKGFSAMQTRITSLLDIFGIKDRFCNNKKDFSIKHILNLPTINYSAESKAFNDMKNSSIEYLNNIIKGTESKKNAC